VPFNPCGRVVDYARREYRTLAKLFRDSDTLVEIQWYRVPESAPRLPWPTAFMSRDWTDAKNDQPWLTELGEVLEAPRPYSFKPPLIDPRYDHVCGTEEDFAIGAAFDPDADVKYDEQGIPLCCRQPRVMSLGVVFGLEVAVEQDEGLTCEDAIIVPPEVFNDVVLPPFATRWYRMEVDTPDTPSISYSTAEFVTATPYRGTDCDTLLPGPGFAMIGTSCQNMGWVPYTGPVWLELTNTTGDDLPVSFRFNYTTC
jgi:hypothetical protein